MQETIFYLVFAIVIFILAVLFTRWVFGIDTIIKELKKQNSQLSELLLKLYNK